MKGCFLNNIAMFLKYSKKIMRKSLEHGNMKKMKYSQKNTIIG